MLRVGSTELHIVSIRYNTSSKLNHLGVIVKKTETTHLVELSSSVKKWDDSFFLNFPHIEKFNWYPISDYLLNQNVGPQYGSVVKNYTLETIVLPIKNKVILSPSYDVTSPTVDFTISPGERITRSFGGYKGDLINFTNFTDENFNP